jgi:hypothetical protein
VKPGSTLTVPARPYSVPLEFQDPSGKYFRFSGQELRQDVYSLDLVFRYSLK